MKNYNYAVRWVIGLTLLMLCQSAMALQVTRGPYLQSGTQTSLIVKWSTDNSVNSHVAYGTSPSNLDQSVTLSGTRRQHEVQISGLTPGSKYYYSVGSSSQTLAGGDTNHYFKSTLAKDSAQPIRIWAIGDSGTANSSARAVRDAYLNYNGSRETDLMIMLGDNAYNDGTDSEYQAAVFNTYPSLLRNTMLWSTLGNHDGHSADSASQSGPYYNIFTFPRNGESGGLASGTEAYFSYDYGDIHFVNLDSYETNRSSNGAMMNWLEADLSSTDKKWIIAFFHHPPYSKGSHNSDSESNLVDMRQNALPILESYGVDLVLSGHSHSYERSYLIDGHYGSSGSFNNSHKVDGGDGREQGNGVYEKATAGAASVNEGAVYIVAGSSGKTSGGSLNHPAMYYSLNSLGSMVIDIDGNRMDARFLDNNTNVRDSFTILKGPSGPQPAAQPVIYPAGGVFANSTVVSLSTATNDANIYYTLNGSDPSASSTPYNQPFTITETTTVKAIAIHSELGDSSIAENQITIIPAGSTLLQGSGSDGILSIEVEHHDGNTAQGGHTWEETFPSGYSGSATMIASPNTGTLNNTGYVSNSPMMEYQVTLVKTGTHYIWVRGIGSSGSDDSVHVGLDGQAVSTSDRIELPSSLNWSEDTMDGVVARVEVDLPGLHTVNVWMREDGAVIDKLVMTTNANYSISGQGPAESPRGRPPVADVGIPDDGSVGAPVSFDGSGSLDEDGDSLTYSWDFGDGSTGTGVSPSHTYNAAGTYSVSLVVNDGHQDSNPDTTTVSITSTNQTPVANPGGPYSGIAGTPVEFTGAASSDPNGDTLTYSWIFGDGASGTGVSPSHTYISAGDYTVQLIVNDGIEDSVAVSTEVTIAQPNPALTANDDVYVTDEDVNLNGNVLSNDTGLDVDSLSIQSHTQPTQGSLVVNDNGSFSYSPSSNHHGADSFTYTVTDGIETGTATVSITVNPVNDSPVITSNAVIDAQQDVLYSYAVQATDVDIGDVLTYSLQTAPSGMTINLVTGLIEWTPGNADLGSHSVTVQVGDAANASVTQSYILSVSNTNEPLTISGTPATTAIEDVFYSFAPTASDSDVSNTLEFSIVNKPSWADFSLVTGELSSTPRNTDVGVYNNIVISVTDGIATASLPAFNLTVINSNDAPIAEDDSGSVNEDTATTILVLANDVDPDGDSISIASVTTPDHGVAKIESGGISYTPSQDYHGTDRFTYTINDGMGGAANAEVTVTVDAVNDLPEIVSAAVIAAVQGEHYEYAVSATDVDGDALLYSLDSAPVGMTINVNTGLIEWLPGDADVGEHDVTVVASDSAAATATQSYTLTVDQGTIILQAVDDEFVAELNTPVTISVIENDTYAVGEALALALVTQPTLGTVVINADNTITYTPSSDVTDTDSFEYSIADSSGATSTATVTIENGGGASMSHLLLLLAAALGHRMLGRRSAKVCS